MHTQAQPTEKTIGIQAKSSTNMLIKAVKLSMGVSILAQPFEVLRTSAIMNKNQDIKNINFKGLYMLSKTIYEQDGVKGFFRGSTLSLARNTLSYLIFFTTLERIQQQQQKLIQSDNKLIQSTFHFLNASTCRLLSTISVSPINVLKTRFEIAGQNQYKSIFQSFKQVKNQEGYSGFYKGMVSTLCRDIPATGIQFSIYQNLLNTYSWLQKFYIYDQENINKIPHTFVISICGSVSSMASLLCVHPFDNLRVRQQCETKSYGLFEMVGLVYKNEGIKGLYKGYLPRLLKKALGGGIIWPLYEQFRGSQIQQQKN